MPVRDLGRWADKRPPAGAEWEYAARGNLESKPYVRGDAEPGAGGRCQANLWLGISPYRNTTSTGQARTAPVNSYLPDGFGLYDSAGNVWEWCAD